MNPDLSRLQSYPFEKLTALKAGITPPSNLREINLSIGEPQHPTPSFIVDAMQKALTTDLGKYPTTKGILALRQQITQWLAKRFPELAHVTLDPERQVLPVNGTREALFAFAQTVIDRRKKNPLVLMPNPFYQIYEGAALLAGASPYYLSCLAENNFQPDFDAIPADVWADCQLIYICSPNNPSGTLLDKLTLRKLIEKSDEFGFIIAADECYMELYADENQAPSSLLAVCAEMGRTDFKNCVIFHSLSKRSNAPGLRSGFVAGDTTVLQQFLLYRTYHGCAMPLAVQTASVVAWAEQAHVKTNRDLYREKFALMREILSPVIPIEIPPASFYLWQKIPISDTQFVQQLYLTQRLTVLPGSYLSRTIDGINPGENRVRIALVPDVEDCREAAHRIRHFLETL
ncbi:succinyldiaminopimelate transaminase [Beggiatoa leptomitoformis]|uniref:Succinyldiaminopimelate transaminase n=1 Tax=Beggiatoa leptomitoformis TaxID=288004 RepID=A0A2N9YHT0_9GAMM|nr:succinyldiaminopimelate transaminase [Beggiatoa leptomitoformis]ALG67654.1 succinyldiaminopimelate transaminase [Beggiatoa leptomitoformis]AUI70111.1 succinyldiaminopimelate transaminase [Beggiatoa leptomitoformis]